MEYQVVLDAPPVAEAEMVTRLRKEVGLTVAAYSDKEEAQWAMLKRMRRAYAMAKRQGLRIPVRSPEDEPFLYDEGEEVSTRVALIRECSPQSLRPVYRFVKQWRIPDLEYPLWVTSSGELTRNIPSVVKARPMREMLETSHELVLGQYDAILRGLESMRVALREV